MDSLGSLDGLIGLLRALLCSYYDQPLVASEHDNASPPSCNMLLVWTLDEVGRCRLEYVQGSLFPEITR